MNGQFVLIGTFLCISIKHCHCTLAGKFYMNRGLRDYPARSDFVQATTLKETSFVKNFKLLTNCSIFVDKTKMIEEFFTSKKHHHHVITYPRRFGKSTNLDMIRLFAQIPVDAMTRKLKNKTKIENYNLYNMPQLVIHEKRYIFEQYFGKYFVIKMSFSCEKMLTFEEALDHLRTCLGTCYLDYVWIYPELEQQYRSEKDSEKRSFIIQRYNILDRIFQHNISEIEITLALKLLCEFITEFSSEKIILLIDDLDAPVMNTKAINSSTERIYNLLHQMINNAFEDEIIRDSIEYSIVTGTSNAILDALTSKAKCFTNHRFLDDHLFANSYGFSESEVDQLFQRHRITNKERIDVKKRFFGYETRNKLQFYNTYAVVQFLSERTIEAPESDEELPNYWSETGSILDNCNFLTIALIRNLITQLICSDRVQMNLNYVTDITIKDVTELLQIANGNHEIFSLHHVSLFFVMFFEHGYLSYTSKPNYYRIPNYEIIRHLEQRIKLYYDRKFPKLKTQFVANNLSTVLYLEYPSALQLTELEISFNELFNMIDRSNNLPSYQYIRNQWEFLSLIYWVSSNFIQYFNKVQMGVDLKLVGNDTQSAYAQLMFCSKGHHIILLIQTVSNSDFIAALDQIQGYVPVYEKFDVVKYLGINIDKNFTVEVGDGTNYGALKLKPGETGFDFAAGYSVFKGS